MDKLYTALGQTLYGQAVYCTWTGTLWTSCILHLDRHSMDKLYTALGQTLYGQAVYCTWTDTLWTSCILHLDRHSMDKLYTALGQTLYGQAVYCTWTDTLWTSYVLHLDTCTYAHTHSSHMYSLLRSIDLTVTEVLGVYEARETILKTSTHSNTLTWTATIIKVLPYLSEEGSNNSSTSALVMCMYM